MTNPKSAKNHKTLAYKIEDIRIVNFFERDWSEYQLKSSDIREGYCDVGFNIKVEPKTNSIAVPVNVVFYLMKDEQKKELFGLEAVYFFKIKRLKQQFKELEPGKYDIPDEFVRSLLRTAVAGVRGMLVALHKIPEYEEIILPLIDTTNLFDAMKRGPRTQS